MSPYLGMKVANAELELRLERANNFHLAMSAQRQKNLKPNVFRNLVQKFKQVKARPAY